MILPSTYKNGFAPRDGKALFPELWRGCIASWTPSLGPSGSRLFDFSPYKNHGLLTNMDPNTDWVLREKQYALDFDGTNDLVNFGSPSVLSFNRTNTFSVSTWFNLSRTNGIFALIGNALVSPPARGWLLAPFRRSTLTAVSITLFLIADSQTGNYIEVTSPVNSITANRWYHVAATYDGTSLASGVEIYIDNKKQTKTVERNTLSLSTVPTSNVVAGGRSDGQFFPGLISDMSIYDRVLNFNEILLLSSRRGIAYSRYPNTWTSEQISAYRARYYSQVLGAGII